MGLLDKLTLTFAIFLIFYMSLSIAFQTLMENWLHLDFIKWTSFSELCEVGLINQLLFSLIISSALSWILPRLSFPGVEGATAQQGVLDHGSNSYLWFSFPSSCNPCSSFLLPEAFPPVKCVSVADTTMFSTLSPDKTPGQILSRYFCGCLCLCLQTWQASSGRSHRWYSPVTRNSHRKCHEMGALRSSGGWNSVLMVRKLLGRSQGQLSNFDKTVKLAEFILSPATLLTTPLPSFHCHILFLDALVSFPSPPTWTASKIQNRMFHASAYSNLYLTSSRSVIRRAKDLNRYFTKEDIRMARKYMKKGAASSAIRETQRKPTVSYHCSHQKGKLNRHQKTEFFFNWKDETYKVLARMYSNWKSCCRFLKSINVRIPYDPDVPLLDIYSRETKADVHTGMYADLHSSFITTAPNCNQPVWV